MRIGSIRIAGVERVTRVLLRNFQINLETGDRMSTANFLMITEPGQEATIGDAVVGSAALGLALASGQEVEIWETDEDSFTSGLWGAAVFGEPLFGAGTAGTTTRRVFYGTIVKLSPKVLISRPDTFGDPDDVMFGGPLFGDPLFGGEISSSNRLNLTAVECRDFNSLLDGTIVSGEFANTSDLYVITTLFAAVPQISLAGLSSGPIGIASLSVVDQSLRNVMNDLTERTGRIYYVDPNLVFNYFSPSERLAPFALSEDPDLSTSFPLDKDSFECNEEWRTPCNSVVVVGAIKDGVAIRRVVENPSSIATYTRKGRTVVDRQIKTDAEAIARGEQELAKDSWPQISGSAMTYQDGLNVGQMLHMELPKTMHINSSYVIRRISLTWENKYVTANTIEFGQYLPDISRAFRALVELASPSPGIQEGVPGRRTVGTEQIMLGGVQNNNMGTGSVSEDNLQNLSVTNAKIQNVSADKLNVGDLTVGGPGHVGQVLVQDDTGAPYGFIGGSADGGWLKALGVGGFGVGSAKLKITNSGDFLLVLSEPGDEFLVTGGLYDVSITQGAGIVVSDGSGQHAEIHADAMGLAGFNTIIFHGSGEVQINGNKVLGARRTGWTAWSGTANRSSFGTGAAGLVNVAEALKALIDDLIAHGIIG